MLIIVIFCSRIYLGAHSIDQVIGGLGFGLIIVLIWKLFGKFTEEWHQGKTASFWILLALGGILCEWLHYNVAPSRLGVMSIGSLIGYGLVLKYIKQEAVARRLTAKLVASMTASLFCLVVIAKYFPIFYENDLSFQISVMLKYAILVLAVYGFPYLLPSLPSNKAGLKNYTARKR